ncbi:hypothetical protein FOZ60_002354 [Perkinsus olseni]|uniref:Uncharacterized protein n=1 Tax=Perkinsus olseni TaxID=32597 RepID=A0A7J6NZA6_PEROL|nr:hypothetical protein FOZ60_002354 [Perkinsus olseni]
MAVESMRIQPPLMAREHLVRRDPGLMLLVVSLLCTKPSVVVQRHYSKHHSLEMHFFVNLLVVSLVAADNACSAADKAAMAGKYFAGFLWHCSESAVLFPKQLIPPCLEKGCSLSKGCAECFGDFGQCGLSCATQCLNNPSGDDCSTCMNNHNCNEPLLKCTGLDNLFPPPTQKYQQCK